MFSRIQGLSGVMQVTEPGVGQACTCAVMMIGVFQFISLPECYNHSETTARKPEMVRRHEPG